MYCGTAIGKGLHHLYECSGGVYKDKGTCPNGCFITTRGENDYCLAQSDSVPGFFINAYTVHMIKSHEGFHETLHQDEIQPQYQSIGYGHLCKPTVAESDCNKLQRTISQNEATIILSQDIKPFESCICTYVSAKLNANQYGVLVAHVFERRHDCQYFRISQLRNLVNGGQFDKVPEEILTYARNSSRSASRYQDLADAWVMKSDVELICPRTF
jgi:GH24 family phage-related lysozyme (muramidase)